MICKEKINKKKEVILVFLICFLPRILMNMQMTAISYEADEVSTISAVTLFTSMDWSNAVSKVGYYGGGFTILLTPLYLLFKNPLTIYHIMLTIVSILQGMTGVIAYHLLKEYFELHDEKALVLISVASSYMVTRRANNITNEHILIFITWILVWLLLVLIKKVDQKKTKAAYSLLLGLVMGYSLSVHERGKTYIIALVILCAFFYWVYRKCLISVIPFVIAYVPLWGIAKKYKSYALSVNWITRTNTVKNSEIAFSNITEFLSPSNWKIIFYSISGPITTALVVSGGLLMIALILACAFWICGIFKRRSMCAGKVEEVETRKKVFVILTFLFACVAMTLVAQAMSWFASLKPILGTTYGSDDYALKELTYIRYFGNYTGPLVMVALYGLYAGIEKKKLEIILKISGIVTLVFSGVWLCKIRPYLTQSTQAIEAFLPFSLETKSDLKLGPLFYAGGVIILLVLLLATYWLIKKKKKYLILLVFAVLMMYQYIYNSYAFDKVMSERRTDVVNTYQFLQKTGISEYVDDLYVSEDSASRKYLTYQFLFYDKKIQENADISELQEGILLSKSYWDHKDLYSSGWKILQPDTENTDYIWIKGEELQNRLEESGYSLVTHEPVVIHRDEKTEENFYLSKGTYDMTIDCSENEEEILENSSVKFYDEEWNIVYEASLANGTIENTQCSIEISTQSGMQSNRIIIEDEQGNILQYSKIEISKISDSYSIASSNYELFMPMLDRIMQLKKINKLIYLNNALDEVDVSYIEQKIPSLVIEQKNEVELNQEDAEVILCSKTDDWMPLLNKYQCIEENSDYVLMISQETEKKQSGMYAVLNEEGYINIEYVCADEWTQNEETYYGFLASGRYDFKFTLGDESDISLENQELGVKIIGDKQEVIFPAYYKEGNVQGSYYLDKDMQNYKFEIITEDQEKVKYAECYIRKAQSSFETFYERNVMPLQDILNQIGWEKEISLYFNDMADINNVMSLTQANYLMNNQITGTSVDNLESDKKTECIIIPNDSQYLYKMLTEYDVLQVTNRYVLLLKNSTENEKLLSENGIEKLSENGYVLRSYIEKENEYGYGVNLPYGNYQVKIAAELVDNIQKGDTLLIQFSTDNGLLKEEYVNVSASDVEKGSMLVEVPVADLNDMYNITIYTECNATGLKSRIEEIAQISSVYCPDLTKYTFENAQYDMEKEAIIAERKSKIYSEIQSVLTGQTYTYTYTYSTTTPKVRIESVNTETGKVNSSSTKAEKIGENTYRTQLIVSPSEDRWADQIVFEINSEDTVEIESVEIEHHQIQN